jgi:hypothetical protein
LSVYLFFCTYMHVTKSIIMGLNRKTIKQREYSRVSFLIQN